MNVPRTATVTAMTACVVASRDRARFDELLRPASPTTARQRARSKSASADSACRKIGIRSRHSDRANNLGAQSLRPLRGRHACNVERPGPARPSTDRVREGRPQLLRPLAESRSARTTDPRRARGRPRGRTGAAEAAERGTRGARSHPGRRPASSWTPAPSRAARSGPSPAARPRGPGTARRSFHSASPRAINGRLEELPRDVEQVVDGCAHPHPGSLLGSSPSRAARRPPRARSPRTASPRPATCSASTRKPSFEQLRRVPGCAIVSGPSKPSPEACAKGGARSTRAGLRARPGRSRPPPPRRGSRVRRRFQTEASRTARRASP